MPIVITQQDDRDSVEERLIILSQLEQLAKRKRAREAQILRDTADIATLGAKVRRWLVRRKPTLDATLPALIEDIHYEKDSDAGASDTLHVNEDAVTQRAVETAAAQVPPE